ncbi:hydroxymethylglutaryl-CoA lyase [soil metagenome]
MALVEHTEERSAGSIKLLECPRDAMQGLEKFIPTNLKGEYLNALLKVGFDTLDFGSFVSPKAVPQMQDTHEVLDQLDLSSSQTKLLAIVANLRGALQAASLPGIDYLGFPLSLSETFQQRNTNKGIPEALQEVAKMQELCLSKGKTMVVYLSMGFGNPYGDPWGPEVVAEFVQKLNMMAIEIIALSDTIGVADPPLIRYLFTHLLPAFPAIELGAHLHTHPATWQEKVEAAYSSGCRRFDSALLGFGGCPMAKDELVGNMPTENLVAYFENIGVPLPLDKKAFSQAMDVSRKVFLNH